MSRRLRIAALCLAATFVLASGASAQTYPSQPIRIVVGFGPASSADIVARLLARQMEQTFRQTVVVENRPGNSSMLAAEAVARAAPDGYTLFMATVANTLNPAQTNSGFNLAQGHGAGRAARRGAECPGRASFRAGEQSQGAGRAGQGQARQPDIRHVRGRNGESSRGRAVQQRHGQQDRGGPLSGRQQPGAQRSPHRPHHADVQCGGDARAARRGRNAQADRGGAAKACRRHARRADDGRGRHAGLRCRHLDRTAGAGQHAAGHRGKACGIGAGRAHERAGAGGVEGAGHRLCSTAVPRRFPTSSGPTSRNGRRS